MNGSPDFLPAFTVLTPEIYLYDPHTSDVTAGKAGHPGAPELIAIFAGLAASTEELVPYIDQHKAIWPSSRMLLVKSPPLYSFFPFISKKDLTAAVPVLQAVSDGTGASDGAGQVNHGPKVLIHVFSNGGCLRMYHFLDVWAAATTAPLPPHSTVFDSCPGIFHFDLTQRAAARNVPMLLRPVVLLFIGMYWVTHVPFGRPTPLDRMYDTLHGDVFSRAEARRAYIYSKEDDLVWWEDVENHASVAEGRKGLAVERALFIGSHHVSHARHDRDRYWRIVRDTWEGSPSR